MMRLAQYLTASASRHAVPPLPTADRNRMICLVEHGIDAALFAPFECDECARSIGEQEHRDHSGLCWACSIKGSEF